MVSSKMCRLGTGLDVPDFTKKLGKIFADQLEDVGLENHYFDLRSEIAPFGVSVIDGYPSTSNIFFHVYPSDWVI